MKKARKSLTVLFVSLLVGFTAVVTVPDRSLGGSISYVVDGEGGMVQSGFLKSQELIALYGLNVVAALLILLIGRWAAKIVRKVIQNIMVRAKVDTTLISFVASLSYVTLMAFVILAALGELGIQTTSFIAVLGAAGLAVGLALQGSLSNFAAGV